LQENSVQRVRKSGRTSQLICRCGSGAPNPIESLRSTTLIDETIYLVNVISCIHR
jgi:hypothetical protein